MRMSNTCNMTMFDIQDIMYIHDDYTSILVNILKIILLYILYIIYAPRTKIRDNIATYFYKK